MAHFDIQATYMKNKHQPVLGMPLNLHFNYLNFEYGTEKNFTHPTSHSQKNQR